MPKKYRPNAAVLITDGQGRILLCQRVDGVFSQIQTVQGGIDPGETAREAAVREVSEEIGLTPEQFDIVAERSTTFCYAWPADYLARLEAAKRTQYIGQEQTYFLAQVHPDVAFDVNTHNQEFARVWWGTPRELIEQCWEVKRPGIEAALREFGLLTDEQTSAAPVR